MALGNRPDPAGRKILPWLFLLMALWHLGCSDRGNYFVVNESRQPIEVRYRTVGASVNGREAFKPVRKTIVSNLADPQKLQTVAETDYTIDDKHGTLTIRLAPREALLVFSGDMGVGDYVEEIRIIGVEGQIWVEGNQVTESFKAAENSDYVLTYR